MDTNIVILYSFFSEILYIFKCAPDFFLYLHSCKTLLREYFNFKIFIQNSSGVTINKFDKRTIFIQV